MKKLKLVSLFSVSVLTILSLFGCGSSKPVVFLPESKESTCIENISGKDYKYLAWGIGDNNELAEVDALKSALWAALAGGGAGNCVSLMNVSEREKNKEYINSLFSNDSEWRTYVRSSNQGRIDPDKRLKLSNGRIKLGIEAIVAIKMLREDLESRGIISGMKIK